MDNNEFRKNAYDMIYLTKCAVNGESPDKARVEAMDLKSVFKVCQKHNLTAGAAFALESVSIHDHNFTQAKEKSIRKIVLLDAERKKVLKRLEQEKIWYMSLKGVSLKEWYPKLGMRQMSDNDILCDGAKRARIKEIMLDMGFTCALYEKGNDDAYYKPPVINFEMHNELFHAATIGKLHEYFDNVKERLIKDEGNEYGYHFSTEDYYLFMLAHEYKHFNGGGTGVRSLVDTYVFLRKFGDSLDWSYINRELNKLEITDFERENRELAMKFFDPETLTAEESSLLDYYISSGTYGIVQHAVKNRIQRNADGNKGKYILQRIFPPMEKIKVRWPFFYRHKWLIPILWLYRPFTGIFKHAKKIKEEIRTIIKK